MKTNTLIDQLKQFKTYHRLNQTDLSTLLGINKFTLNRWLRGKNKPSPAYEKIIRKELKITIDKSQ